MYRHGCGLVRFASTINGSKRTTSFFGSAETVRKSNIQTTNKFNQRRTESVRLNFKKRNEVTLCRLWFMPIWWLGGS